MIGIHVCQDYAQEYVENIVCVLMEIKYCRIT